MEIKSLFLKIYGTHYSEMPEGYRNILVPTMKNCYDFVLVMEKMIAYNISVKAFQKDSFLINGVERRNEKGGLKGSLTMFSEWMKANMITNIDVDEEIITPLKTYER